MTLYTVRGPKNSIKSIFRSTELKIDLMLFLEALTEKGVIQYSHGTTTPRYTNIILRKYTVRYGNTGGVYIHSIEESGKSVTKDSITE